MDNRVQCLSLLWLKIKDCQRLRGLCEMDNHIGYLIIACMFICVAYLSEHLFVNIVMLFVASAYALISYHSMKTQYKSRMKHLERIKKLFEILKSEKGCQKK